MTSGFCCPTPLLFLTLDMPCWYWNNVAPALLLDRTRVVLDGLHIAPVFVRAHHYCVRAFSLFLTFCHANPSVYLSDFEPDLVRSCTSLGCCSVQLYVCGLYVFNLLVLQLNTDQPIILRVHL